MPYPKKYEKSVIRSMRVPQSLDSFFREFFARQNNSELTANEFIVRLVEDTKEYQTYQAQKFAESSEPKLQLY